MGGHIYAWSSGLDLTSGKMTLTDYNFETPRANLETPKELPKGTHPDKSHEVYDYPGHFRTSGDGTRRARVRMEAEAVRHKSVTGAACFSGFEVGRTFTMFDHERIVENAEFLMIRAVHLMRQDTLTLGLINGAWQDDVEIPHSRIGLALGDDVYRIDFRAIPSGEQYRGPLVTPWPEIAGVHTAVVTGPEGEEIHTDKYGRVKVKFHWDRLGKDDDTSSCWVRCMMPWTGKQWGMIHIPRIGQEVVVDFEEGDPDRPLVVGMLYNADTMPPYDLPGKMTQSGVKTRSTKQGSGFNELMFEDKKGAELVRFQAQRDYQQIVKNNAEITIGEATKKDGDLMMTVHNHYKTDVMEGQYTLNVHDNDYAAWVHKNHWEIIDGNKDKTIDGTEKSVINKDVTRTIKTGNLKDTIKLGNVDQNVKLGNHTTKVDLGNYTTELGVGNISVKTGAGKITMEALQSIALKVGGSSIKVDMMGVTIKGPMIKVDGSMMTEVKGGIMTKVEGGGMLVLKGGITMIN